MLRIAVSVEGPTEREFITEVVRPCFLGQAVYLQPIPLNGNVSIDRAISEIKKLLYSFDGVTTLYDFYGFKGRNNLTVVELEKELSLRVPTEKKHSFIPYIQKYEFEALLFSNPQILASEFSQPNKISDIMKIVKEYGDPEEINHGYETCPSRQISGLFASYNKKLHGPIIGKKIGLENIRNQCKRFNGWIERIEIFCSINQNEEIF